MALLSEYGLFLAKIVTVVIAIAIILILMINTMQRNRQRGRLRITLLSKQYKEMQEEISVSLLDSAQKKQWNKMQKKKRKYNVKGCKVKGKQTRKEAVRPRAYVIDFNGSIDAHEVASLREEITTVLSVAEPKDRVVLRLESLGGVVHGYGLAASQLQRLRDKHIPLIVAVDKVAASGGYMMACVADKIIAAPFAILGSIGVVAQIPNFNRFLKKKEIDIELHTTGQYKRTLTLLGENTEEGRKKFREALNETHFLFKDFVQKMRPVLDVDQVATGEYWYGVHAKEKGLIDEVGTSDDLLLSLMEEYELVGIRFTQHKTLLERFTYVTANSADELLLGWLQRRFR